MTPNLIDEAQLKRLIGDAFDALPEPDAFRLNSLEDRLTRNLSQPSTKSKPSLWYWWVIGALAATGAAAWWVGERIRQAEAPRIEQPVESAVVEEPRKQTTEEAGAEAQMRERAKFTPEDRHTRPPPVIYQREH